MKEAQASRCKVNNTATDDALRDITGMLLDVGSPYTHDRDMLVSSQRRRIASREIVPDSVLLMPFPLGFSVSMIHSHLFLPNKMVHTEKFMILLTINEHALPISIRCSVEVKKHESKG